MKPLFVGESNPYGADPEFALYPSPRGCSGDRLCRLVLRMDPDAYLDRFDRVNLCVGKWSLKVARQKAAVLRGEREGPVVILGSKVCGAFDMEFRPFTSRTWPEHGDHQIKYVVLPHPSGLSRAWHEHGAFDRARGVLRSASVIQ
jgi:hypothetical protein